MVWANVTVTSASGISAMSSRMRGKNDSVGSGESTVTWICAWFTSAPVDIIPPVPSPMVVRRSVTSGIWRSRASARWVTAAVRSMGVPGGSSRPTSAMPLSVVGMNSPPPKRAWMKSARRKVSDVTPTTAHPFRGRDRLHRRARR